MRRHHKTEHIPLSQHALGLLATMKEVSDSPFLFPGNVPDKPLQDIKRSWKRICEQAKLKDVRLHDLRHTHATLMMEQGTNPKVVSERLGHASVAITLDVYSHVLPGMQEAAALRFDEALSRKEPVVAAD